MSYAAIDADGVIAMAAATAASAGLLAEHAGGIQAQVDTVSHLVPGGPAVRSRAAAVVGDLMELSGWARGVALRYVDDEKPLHELVELGFWMPDFSKLGWDGKKSAAENVDTTLRSDEFGAFVLGLGAAMLERYRHFTLAVPKPGTVALALPEPDDVVRELRNLPVVRRPSGLYVPQGSSADPNLSRIAQQADNGWYKPGPALVDDVKYGRPPTWAKFGGRALGAAGTVLTLYDSFKGQWEQDSKYHPEWGTGQRVANAGYTMATEGGGAVAGGLVGAQVGAYVGSFVPIPVVGTVGGALVGGAIGAFAGSKAGKATGRLIKEGAQKVWKGLFG